ncbi:MAG: GNAT family N-acetyltransferase [Pseudomonadota bacterium]
MRIRRFAPEDAAACAELFYRAVREGAVEKYDEAQRTAWAPHVPNPEKFGARLGAEICFVAEDNQKLEGFMSLTTKGHLSMAFVAPDRRGTGLTGQLYEEILGIAKAAKLTRLTVHASHYARSFFEKEGWEVVEKEEVDRDGILIPRFLMAISLRD